MKNTKKGIIERFKNFDFDPQEKNQKQIFNKITAPAPAAKKRPKYMKFVFAAAVSFAALVIVINSRSYKNEIAVESDITAQSSVEIRSVKETAAALPQSENAGMQAKAALTVQTVAIDGGKEVPLENAYIWLDNKLSGKTDDKGSWTKKVNAGEVKGRVVVKDYEEKDFTMNASPEKDGTVKVVMKPAVPQPEIASGYAVTSESSRYMPAPGGSASTNKSQRYYDAGRAKSAPTRQVSADVIIAGDSGYARSAAKKFKSSSASEKQQVSMAKYSAVEKEESLADEKVTVYKKLSEPQGINVSADVDYNAIKDESYKKYEENSFCSTVSDPLSTFSADVDVASYNMFRQAVMAGRKPNPDSVRIEEFLNYFDYSYPQPQGADPVSMNFEYTDSPWNKGLKLVKIGIKAKEIKKDNLPPSNLVFLIDVSGSMQQENRLPLVKQSMMMLVDELRPQDRVSIVTYANGVSERLSGAKGSEKEKISAIIKSLYAGGGTNGSEGLALAYETAKKNFIRKGNNRVILATDGDFNIGPRSDSELENQITQARDSGVYLSVLGYGIGNYKDSKMQTLANKGNGNYAYINDLFEAQKTLIKEFGATLFTVAKDVKLQVEFNPAFVCAYRLIGYEKRALATQDFNDDAKDAGEMGAGHTVTVIYEIIPAGVESKFMPDVEKLKYTKTAAASGNGDVLTLKLRYKEPDSDTSKLMERSLRQKDYIPFAKASNDMRFAASVAEFGQIVKDSLYKGDMTIDEVISAAKKSKGADEEGYRTDFVKMAEMYKMIQNGSYNNSGNAGNNGYVNKNGAVEIVCPHCGLINTVPQGRKLRYCVHCAMALN